jgi:hypothetical protein
MHTKKFINRLFLLIFTLLIIAILHGCSEEHKTKPTVKTFENQHPRLSDLNPRAWEDLPMEVVIADFQQSDGIFTSFICDEINKRLSTDPSGSLRELHSIDKTARTSAFKICLSPEVGAPAGLLISINKYSNDYPELVKEITDATQ